MYETNFYCEDEDEVAVTPDAIYVSVLDSEETVLIDQATPTLVSTGHYSYEYDGESGIVSYTFKDGDLDKSGYAHVEIELDTLTKKLISENSISLVIKNRV